MFLVLGVFGCNSDGSDLDINLDEFIDSPTNLRINGKVLSWDAVEEAKGYIVYVNGVEEDKVSTNSYDFSGLTGDKLVFQVQTDAPRGMQDSGLSVKIAYVANPEQEISAINEAMANMDDFIISSDPDFAVELVNKGMVASEFNEMVTAIETFNDATYVEYGGTPLTMTEYYSALNSLMAEMDNIEALVSAYVKTELLSYLYIYKADLGDQPEYADVLASINELIYTIENNPDEIVISITTTIEYFISIEEMISNDLLSTLEDLALVEDPSELEVNDLLLVKEEVADILRETLPSQEDMVLMYEVYNVFLAMSGADMNQINSIENYTGKMAIQSLYSIEAVINFLDSLDQDFFTDAVGFLTSDDYTEAMAMAEVQIMVVKAYDEFRDDNEKLLDSINEVFTDEEKEIIYENSTGSYDYLEGGMNTVLSGLANLDFQTIIYLQSTFEEGFDAALDMFVERDGELIRQITISEGFDFYYSYSETEFINSATLEEYSNYTQARQARDLQEMDVMIETLYIVDAFANTINDADYDEVLNMLLSAIPVDELANELDMNATDIQTIYTMIKIALDNSSNEQLDLIKELISFIVDQQVIQGYKVVMEKSHTYYEAEYGDNYIWGGEYYEDDYSYYANSIYIAQVYDTFMTSARRDNVDVVVGAFITQLLVDANQSAINDVITSVYGTGEYSLGFTLTDENVGYLSENLDSLLDFLKSELGDIADLNYENLSAADKLVIDTFEQELLVKMLSLFNDPDLA
jgi:hypothetical protein